MIAENSAQSNQTPAKKFSFRAAIEPMALYPRSEAANLVGVSVITLIRAFDSGNLNAYRVGRRVMHSGQHILDWLEAGGRTSRKAGCK